MYELFCSWFQNTVSELKVSITVHKNEVNFLFYFNNLLNTIKAIGFAFFILIICVDCSRNSLEMHGFKKTVV